MSGLRFTIVGKVYEFHDKTLMASEAILLQKVTGRTIAELNQGRFAADFEAMHAFIWLAMRRAGENIKYSELDYDIMEMKVEEIEDAEKSIVDPPVRPTRARASKTK